MSPARVILPPPPAIPVDVQAKPQRTISSHWRAVQETAVATVRPGRA
jgi:hypothetical protein